MNDKKPQSAPIAIVGMAGRFPGANNTAELWQNLCAGTNSISQLKIEELEDNTTNPPENYVRARGILKDVDKFDAEYFGFLPREADVTDPQQRVLLECASDALEDAGYDPARYRGRIGVIAGSSINTYLLLHLASDRQFIETFTNSYQTGSFQELIGNGQDFLATRISYKLNLRGPAFTVQSACSTSLLAVAQACDCLRSGDADMVLAGGVSISFPQQRGYLYLEGGMVSPDGRCRPFDAQANGTVFGAGAGMVLLKRLDEAISDGDHIYAVIAGEGVSNDGSAKMGYAAPSIDGQTAAIVKAHEAAGISAAAIGYVECHGTGTPLGDPIEVRALDQAFAKSLPAGGAQKQFCAIGSVKSAIGHLDVAAGVTGLIKTALILQNEAIPPTLHFDQPNPNIDFSKTPFHVNAATTPWPRNHDVRRAGVSAFGVGGTNVHLVVAEAPKTHSASPQTSARSSQLFVLSAANAQALNDLKERIANKLETDETSRVPHPCPARVGLTKPAANVAALEGYGLQPVHKPGRMDAALAAEGSKASGEQVVDLEGYGLQPVHKPGRMDAALAAEGSKASGEQVVDLEGYGLQPVHKPGRIDAALAAEGSKASGEQVVDLEGYGLQPVHKPGRIDAALAAEVQSQAESNAALADAAYTLATGRREMPWRIAIAATTREAAAAQLRQAQPKQSAPAKKAAKAGAVFMFPGQGSQYPHMGSGLYRTEPAYRRAIDECAEILRPMMQCDIRDILFPTGNLDEAAETLRQTRFSQPAIFITSYATAQLWMEWGIKPAYLAGHSIGEFVAACLAGVFTLPDALHAISLRASLMQSCEAGAMTAVRISEASLSPLLAPEVSIAAVNGANACVASGPFAAIDALERELTTRSIAFRRLKTSHAFHSAMMRPVRERLEQFFSTCKMAVPTTPLISSVAGEWLTADQATSPTYWATQCIEPVRFHRAIQTLTAKQPALFLEVGAGNTLAALAKQSNASPVFSSLPGAASETADIAAMQNALGSIWSAGYTIDWTSYYRNEQRRRRPLPTYPFQRTRHWVDVMPHVSPQPAQTAASDRVEPGLHDEISDKRLSPSVPEPQPVPETGTPMTQTCANASAAKTIQIADQLQVLFEELSGVNLSGDKRTESFLELGFDSLFLTQVSQQVQRTWKVKVTFRQMLEQCSSLQLLAEYLTATLPAEPEITAVAPPPPTVQPTVPAPQQMPVATVAPASFTAPTAATTAVEALMQHQLTAFADLMKQQLTMLQTHSAPPVNGHVAPAPTVALPNYSSDSQAKPTSAPAQVGGEAAEQPLRSSPVFASAKPASSKTAMTGEQRAYIDQLIARVCAKTAASKTHADQYRKVHADPRSASGFRPEWKEMVYSMVVEKSAGSKLWDIDGNEYIDLVNGFGATMFGHGPAFVTEALKAQADLSVALGPQTPLAGECAKMICELTGNERVTFCNTGSEAVMAATRIARTVTARDKVVIFAGDYHGQFDEVLVKGIRRSGEPHTLPAAPGIPRKNIENMVVLEYGTPESLAWIEQHADELAAVLVEPVQSRHPDLQPKEFLTAVRRITEKSETALIFDEVVTGFRIHPGGAQAFFGIRADMATYGKVAGGGVALGILAGKAKFMDALDGGEWHYGDDSYPSVGMTFFAGTFVRHALTMAVTHATLKHIQTSGMEMYSAVNAKADKFKAGLNNIFAKRGIGVSLEQYGSIMYFHLPSDVRFASLLYFLLRDKGIYILEGFPLYLTTAHTDADIEKILSAMDQSIVELQDVGLLPGNPVGDDPQPTSEKSTSSIEISMTEPQLEILLAAQAGDEASCAFNESFSLHLEGALRVDALEKAFAEVIANHDALRITMNSTGDRLLVHPQMQVGVKQVDLASLTKEQQEAERKQLVIAEGTTAFDLATGPLVRARLLSYGADRFEFIITAHHMICDGWSVNLITDELGRRYSSIVDGKQVELDKTISFCEYATSLESSETRAHRAEAQDHWTTHFSSIPDLIDLPTDRPRGSARTFNGSTYFADLSPQLMKSLRQTGAGLGATLFATLLGTWQIMLSKLSGSADVITLIPAAAQSQMEDATFVGHSAHLLPVVSSVQPEQTVADLLRQVKHGVLDAYDHQRSTLASIVHALRMPPVAGRLPLSEVQFNLERVGSAANFSALKASVRANGKRFVNFDLFLNIVESTAGLRLECDYNTDLYDEATIARWLRYYENLLQTISADAQVQIVKLSLLSELERNRLLVTLNATDRSYPADLSIPALLSRQVEASPNSIAVEFYGRKLTRKELDLQSNQIATVLRNSGIGSGQLVGIYIERSTEMLVAMLGVLKSGAAYVPLDPLYPKERVAAILDETDMSMLLTLDRHLDALPENIPTVSLDRPDWRKESANAADPVSSEALAYVIFTSGSTGKPKGVEITHRSVVNLLLSVADETSATEDDRLLAVTTLTFDIAAMELLLPLVTGGTLVIASRDDAADGTRLIDLLRTAKINTLQATPITWRMLLDAGFQSQSGFKMFCGGESWDRDMALRLLAGGGRLWNMYGPTETTIWSSVNEIKSAGEITIGPPIANTRFYVLDSARQPVPAGVIGELYIAGEGVARGYYKRFDLTNAAFMDDPFRAGSQMYKTGDLVRQFADGRIQYLRRADHQIKLRGFRIELEEIERAIADAAAVSRAIVTLKMDRSNDPRLVAYLQPNPSTQLDTESIRTTLLSRLPEYMVPAYWLVVDQFPLTANRKIDRKALPEPEWSKVARHKQFVVPETPTQQKMAAIWSEVMRIDQISIEDNLLELGADSLKIFQISARCNRSGIKVTAKQLMVLKTITAICAELDKSFGKDDAPAAGPVVRVSRGKYRVHVPPSAIVSAEVPIA